jgi:hypothetical protein
MISQNVKHIRLDDCKMLNDSSELFRWVVPKLRRFVSLERLEISITYSNMFYELRGLFDARYLLENVNYCFSEDWVLKMTCGYILNLKLHKNFLLILRYCLDELVRSSESKCHLLMLTVTV